MATFSNNIATESPFKFSCEKCNYYTSHKSHLNYHLVSLKHIRNNELATISNTIAAISKKYCCENCGKEYAERTGLWRHKKKCSENNSDEEKKQLIEVCELANNIYKSSNIISQHMIIEIIKQNQEFKDLLLEQNKTIIELSKNNTITNNNNITHSNSHNKTFNLQFFLNEECKDALNISEFVNSIKVQLADLETTGRLGYVEGVSRIINKKGEPRSIPGEEGADGGAPAGDDQQPDRPVSVAQVRLAPDRPQVASGDALGVTVLISGADGVGNANFQLRYDPKVLRFVPPAEPGDFMVQGGAAVDLQEVEGAEGGLIVVSLARSGAAGASGTGALVRLNFVALARGNASFGFSSAAVRGVDSQVLPASFRVSSVEVTP